MSPLLNSREIGLRAEHAYHIAEECVLCPRECAVNRSVGETGFCQSGIKPKVAKVIAHFGEEPPLVVGGGAGTIFFSNCNMRCVFCQNFQISQSDCGAEMEPAELAHKLIALQALGCSNIEPVSPTHHLPGFLEALACAMDQGLNLPVVYNSNGYEKIETLELLDGVVDVYLPDLKYYSDSSALKFSSAPNYFATATAAISEMCRQTGNLAVDNDGSALRGTIVRHLVLPGQTADTFKILDWIRRNLPHGTWISLMAQYSPIHKAALYPELNTRVTEDEYDRVVDFAWESGLENVFTQELDSQDIGIPDFHLSTPFKWE
jgi:putative pyruvate formate lyase activating enzyme